MGTFTFEPPVINTSDMDEKQQLKEINSWLFKLTEELRHAFSNIDANDIYFQDGSTIIHSSGMTERQRESIAQEMTSLRELIIKTADSVEETADSIRSELNSNYLALSDFGVYKEQVTQQITDSAEGITREFVSREELSTRITEDGTISSTDSETAETRQYIKCGYLFGSGVNKKYGVAVGENLTILNGELVSENLATTMTSDRISFWNAGTEVAYISNSRLFITEAQIISRIRLGQWSIETDNGFVIKWNGGEQVSNA